MNNFQEKVAARIEFQDKMVKRELWQCCTNCLNFTEATEICINHNSRPPAYIIVSGCKDHEFDIPF